MARYYRAFLPILLSVTLLSLGAAVAADVSALTPAQIVKQEQDIDQRIGVLTQSYRAAMESLLKDLKRNCLQEPGRSCFRDVETLTNAVMYGEPDPEMFVGFKHIFALPSSHKLLDLMANRARESAASIAKLDAQRPTTIVRKKWNPLTDKVNAALRKAADALTAAAGTTGPIESRASLIARIDTIEKNDAALAAASKAPAADLEAILGEVRAFGDWAKNFDQFAVEARKAIETIEKQIATLRSAQQIDRASIYRYHRSFAQGLPDRIATLAEASAMGSKVRQAEKAEPGSWAWAAISHLYREWQRDAYDKIMAAGLRSRLEEARSARHGAEYQGEYQRWATAATALKTDEITELSEFWSSGALEPERYAKDRQFSPVLEAVIGEYERNSANGLAVVNPQQFLAEVTFSQAAKTRHLSLLRNFNSNRTLADLSTMHARLAQDRTEHPDDWTDGLWRKYADLQEKQFRALFTAVYADRAGAADKVHLYRRHDPAPWKKACAAFTQPEVRELVEYFGSGQMREMRVHQVYAKPFWLDVLNTLEEPPAPQPASAAGQKPPAEPSPQTTPAPETAEKEDTGGFFNRILRTPINVLEGAREGLEKK